MDETMENYTEPERTPFKVNVLILVLIGAAMVILLAIMFPQHGDLVFAVAGGLVGTIGCIGRDLVAPEPEKPGVPPEVVQLLLDRL